jgi:hypothetical protein
MKQNGLRLDIEPPCHIHSAQHSTLQRVFCTSSQVCSITAQHRVMQQNKRQQNTMQCNSTQCHTLKTTLPLHLLVMHVKYILVPAPNQVKSESCADALYKGECTTGTLQADEIVTFPTLATFPATSETYGPPQEQKID